jgi:hypothetical protein
LLTVEKKSPNGAVMAAPLRFVHNSNNVRYMKPCRFPTVDGSERTKKSYFYHEVPDKRKWNHKSFAGSFSHGRNGDSRPGLWFLTEETHSRTMLDSWKSVEISFQVSLSGKARPS